MFGRRTLFSSSEWRVKVGSKEFRKAGTDGDPQMGQLVAPLAAVPDDLATLAEIDRFGASRGVTGLGTVMDMPRGDLVKSSSRTYNFGLFRYTKTSQSWEDSDTHVYPVHKA